MFGPFEGLLTRCLGVQIPTHKVFGRLGIITSYFQVLRFLNKQQQHLTCSKHVTQQAIHKSAPPQASFKHSEEAQLNHTEIWLKTPRKRVHHGQSTWHFPSPKGRLIQGEHINQYMAIKLCHLRLYPGVNRTSVNNLKVNEGMFPKSSQHPSAFANTSRLRSRHHLRGGLKHHLVSHVIPTNFHKLQFGIPLLKMVHDPGGDCSWVEVDPSTLPETNSKIPWKPWWLEGHKPFPFVGVGFQHVFRGELLNFGRVK